MSYQKTTGPLMANSHPGSYSGQDAYNDMFVTARAAQRERERESMDDRKRPDTSDGSVPGSECTELHARSTDSADCYEEIYECRRPTPTECQFLQGFPNIVELSDSSTRDEVAAVAIATGTISADPKTGKVYRTRGPGGMILKTPIEVNGADQNGYLVCRVSAFGQKRQIKMHRLVWMVANGMIPDGLVIDHINNNKKDNRLENLQLLTPIENSKKAHADGLIGTKEDGPTAKITNVEHDFIQYLYWTRKRTCRELAIEFGISESRANQIIHEKTWCGDVPHTDSAEYKLWGNGIALPCLLPMFKAMKKILEGNEGDNQ